jgi:hypothetical protein
MKSKFLSLTLAVSIVAATAHGQEQAAPQPTAPSTPVYNVVVSNAAGPNDAAVLVSKRVGGVFSFKLCPARTKEGRETPAGALRRLRFDPSNTLTDIAASAPVYQTIFNDPSCKVIGSPMYGFAQGLKKDDGRIDPGYGWSMLPLQLIPAAVSALAVIVSSFGIAYEYSTVRRSSNGLSVWGILASPNFKKTPLVIAAVGVAVISGVAANLFHASHVQDDLAWYEFLIQNSIDSKNAITVVNDSMEDFVAKFNLGLRTALEQKALVPL